MDDIGREAVLLELSNRMYQICERRSVSCKIDRKVRALSYVVLLLYHILLYYLYNYSIYILSYYWNQNSWLG